MDKKKLTSTTGILLTVLVLLVGCAQQAAPAAPTAAPAATKAPAATTQAAPATTQAAPAPATSAAAATAPAAPAETLRIGVMMALTGPIAPTSTQGQRAMLVAVDDWNQKGGLKAGGKTYKIEAAEADDKGTSEGGVEAANRLILAEKVKILLGITTGGVLAGVQPIAEKAGALIVTQGASSTGTINAGHPTTLVAGTTTAYARYNAMSQWLAKNRPQAKRVLLMAPDDATGKGEAPIWEQTVKEAGLTPVGPEYFPGDTRDFTASVVRVLAQKPDVVELSAGVSASPVQSLGIAKALSEQGWKGPFVGTYGNASLPQGGATTEGFVFPHLMERNWSSMPPLAKEAIDRYVKKHGEGPDFNVGSAVYQYNTSYVTLQALEKAGTVDDVAKIADVLRSNQWDTTLGKVGFGGAKTYGIKSLLEVPVIMGKVEGGKLVNFEMVSGAVP